jgi:hypothetical protein
MRVGRPAGYQWEPLGLDVDPVPGEPSAVSQEAAHLSSVAKTITDQVTALKKISSGGTDAVLEGDYADKIRSSADSLAGQLNKVVGRYQKVASALKSYVPDLQHAQSMSLTALNEASGPAAKLSSLNGQTMPTGSNLTAKQQQQVSDHKTALTNATGALNDARALLHKATSLRDHSASHCASQIHSASNDSMKDHWYTGFKNWLSENWVDWLKSICTILEIIGTVLAIAAFIIAQFIPGLDVLVDVLVVAAFAATAAATVGRLVEALTGNGSWWDFALDAFACLTFGAGKVISAGLRAIAEGSEAAAKGLISGERGLMLLKGEMILSKSADMFDDQALTRIAVKYMAKVEQLVPDLEDVKEVSRLKWAINLFGDADDFKNFAKISTIGQRFAGSVADNVAMAEHFVKFMGTSSILALSTGGLGAIAGGIVIGNEENPIASWRIPGLSQFYDNTFEKWTGG